MQSFRLRDGRSIRTVSALLFQLVQTSAHDVRTGAMKMSNTRQQNLVRQDGWVEKSQENKLLDDRDLEVRRFLARLT